MFSSQGQRCLKGPGEPSRRVPCCVCLTVDTGPPEGLVHGWLEPVLRLVWIWREASWASRGGRQLGAVSPETKMRALPWPSRRAPCQGCPCVL